MKLDLHLFHLEDAIQEILATFHRMLLSGETQLEIIHGHVHGTRIRNYLDAQHFVEDCCAEGIRIKTRQRHSNGGATTFTIELPPKRILIHKKDPKCILDELRKNRKIVL